VEERTFTVEQANEQVAWLQDVLPRIRESRQVVLAGAQRIRGRAAGNGTVEQPAQYSDALSSLRRDVTDLTERGIILRDPETGLVDFPSEREGRQILLCWRLGEDRVAFYHGPQSGFSSRRPL
jgi:hypothetical protein